MLRSSTMAPALLFTLDGPVFDTQTAVTFDLQLDVDRFSVGVFCFSRHILVFEDVHKLACPLRYDIITPAHRCPAHSPHGGRTTEVSTVPNHAATHQNLNWTQCRSAAGKLTNQSFIMAVRRIVPMYTLVLQWASTMHDPCSFPTI